MNGSLRGDVSFGGRKVGGGAPCLIIAEIGVNHNGDVDTALAMIDAIADAGAECVKFQTFRAEEFVNDPTDVYEYLSQGKLVRESMLEMFQRLELKYGEFERLFAHARARGLIPLSTPTDTAAVDLLERIGTPAYKIGSDDLVYTPFLRAVARKGKPIILSTGMAGAADVERAVAAIREEGNDQIVLLHCVSLYPTPDDKVNLRRMSTLRAMFDAPIGFSDHSAGITAALGAVALGARIIEKHFTLDRDMPGPDHRFSADPAELAALVREVRRLEDNLGSGRFTLSAEEEDMARLAHRSIIFARDLTAGDLLQPDDLAYRRPGLGLMPYDADKLIGKRLTDDVVAGTPAALAVVTDAEREA